MPIGTVNGISHFSGSGTQLVKLMDQLLDILETEEVAWIEGCGRVRAIFKVLLPQCGHGIAVVWFMTFTFAWGEFMIPLILLRRMEMMPLAVGIFTAFGEYGVVDYGFLSALLLVYTIPPVVMYIFIRKYLVKGMVGYIK